MSTRILSTVMAPLQRLGTTLENIPAARQQTIMHWVGGLSPLATNVVTPIVTYYRFNKSDLPEAERQFNVKQEVARQSVSAVLQVASFFGGAWLFGHASGKNSKTLVQFLGGVLCAFVSYAFIRPMVSSEIILRWLYSNEDKTPHTSPSHATLQEQRFSAFIRRASAPEGHPSHFSG